MLKNVDAGTTLRVTVDRHERRGLGRVDLGPDRRDRRDAAARFERLPDSGTGTVQIADVTPPARLQIDQQTVTPGVVTPSAKTIQAALPGHRLRRPAGAGSSRLRTAVPVQPVLDRTRRHDGSRRRHQSHDGAARRLPRSRQQGLLVVFVRARKASDPLTGGISTRLLVSFPVSLR